MVGARGFEPPTPCSQSRCATRLRYAPMPLDTECLDAFGYGALRIETSERPGYLILKINIEKNSLQEICGDG